jgi:hypothetical protein
MFSGERIETYIGYRIDAVKWDSDKQRVVNNCTNKLKQSASLARADFQSVRIVDTDKMSALAGKP